MRASSKGRTTKITSKGPSTKKREMNAVVSYFDKYYNPKKDGRSTRNSSTGKQSRTRSRLEKAKRLDDEMMV